MSKLVAALVALFLPVALAAAPPSPSSPVHNVILFVGDGLGASERLMGRLVSGTALTMDGMPAWAVTTPGSLDGPAPDTAAACTALATGHKTRNNLLSIGSDGTPLLTLLEAAHKAGRGIGVVTNLSVTHASVAGFYAHATRRDDELGTAEQVPEHGPDVLLGGGQRYFLPADKDGRRSDNRNLETEAAGKGYQVVHTTAELDADGKGKLLGLFSSGAMNYELDRKTASDVPQPDLADMTRVALRRLSANPNGFVLIVNQGHLDWACHDHDAASAAREVLVLDDAVHVAEDFAHGRNDTLMVVAASHETSGLAITPTFQADALRSARTSLEHAAAVIRQDRGHYEAALGTLLGWDKLTTEEKEDIVLASDPSKGSAEGGTGQDALVLALGQILSARVGVAWASTEHTGDPCPLSASGAEARSLNGAYDTTDVPRRLAHLLQLQLP